MLPAVPEGRRAGADPLVAAVVALVLLLQALEEALHELVDERSAPLISATAR
jgi:hypothetical protein